MTEPARRDLVWDAVLRALAASPAGVRQRDVQYHLESDVSERTIRRTLGAMATLGWLVKEKEGGHYWLPGPRAREYLSVPGDERFGGSESSSQESLEEIARETTERESRSPTPEELDETAEDSVDLEAVVDGLPIPGDGELKRNRRENVVEILEYLREVGRASPSDLQEEFFVEGEYGYGSKRSWWKNFVYQALSECDLVETGGAGSHSWMWVGENGNGE